MVEKRTDTAEWRMHREPAKPIRRRFYSQLGAPRPWSEIVEYLTGARPTAYPPAV